MGRIILPGSGQRTFRGFKRESNYGPERGTKGTGGGGGGGGSTPSTLDPTNKHPNAILSNGDLTVTHTVTENSYVTALGTIGKDAGLVYFETTYGSGNNATRHGVTPSLPAVGVQISTIVDAVQMSPKIPSSAWEWGWDGGTFAIANSPMTNPTGFAIDFDLSLFHLIQGNGVLATRTFAQVGYVGGLVFQALTVNNFGGAFPGNNQTLNSGASAFFHDADTIIGKGGFAGAGWKA